MKLWLLALLFLSSCAASFPTREARYSSDLSSLRAERLELERRLASARMRMDTARFNASPFPTGGDGEVAMLESRLSSVNERIHRLEAKAAAANTSVAEP